MKETELQNVKRDHLLANGEVARPGGRASRYRTASGSERMLHSGRVHDPHHYLSRVL